MENISNQKNVKNIKGKQENIANKFIKKGVFYGELEKCIRKIFERIQRKGLCYRGYFMWQLCYWK